MDGEGIPLAFSLFPGNANEQTSSGTVKKERRNPNDSARFIGKIAATEDGESAKIHNYLDTEKIKQEALYDGIYAVTTDLLDDDVKGILKVVGKLRNVFAS